ncbi:MAG: right-handed parallel beta-helix repeat-containing protein [Pirellulaceae bacterium]
MKHFEPVPELDRTLSFPGRGGVPAWFRNRLFALIALAALLAQPLVARDYHVSPQGGDGDTGSRSSPLKTISAAARIAQPGDVITVHEGTYRERINPPRGGLSETRRITYQAAEGETVIIKGSEVVIGWVRAKKHVWKATLPNTFFPDVNPYKELIHGDWFDRKGRDHHTGEIYLNGAPLFEAASLADVMHPAKKGRQAWYCEVDDKITTLWADFRDADPNKECVEIHVRECCFYPDTPGRNYITVRGFRMSQAATQWAAPTAEQVGLVGTHWSKGWVIENNVIHDSKCVGITLGKDRASGHNDAQSAEGYNVVVRRALENGWSRETIGSHLVRNNTIYNCGAAGICGSMGGAFSKITGNHIHHIHLDKPFGGAEMAGIKLHAAIDTLISHNWIHDTCRGIWLDWMAQGTRVTANLCHDNGLQDLFLEVNHGPYVVDNNIFLTSTSVQDWSEGGAFAHNLLAGDIRRETPRRKTPYHRQHSTEIVGLMRIRGGDNRFHNNIIVGGEGLQVYDDAKLPLQADGNLYLPGAVPCRGETRYVQLSKFEPNVRIAREEDGVYLHLTLPAAGPDAKHQLVTTELLGKARIPDLPYANPDGTPLRIDIDYFSRKRNEQNPSTGPFEDPGTGEVRLKVWRNRQGCRG